MVDASLSFRMPPSAYVPGQTERHPEGCFDDIRASVFPGATAEDLARSQAYRAGLAYLHEGYFWECHELLEAVWMALPEQSPDRAGIQALIQLANARLKLRMNRPKAALRLCEMVDGHLARATDANPVFELDLNCLEDLVKETRSQAYMHYRA